MKKLTHIAEGVADEDILAAGDLANRIANLKCELAALPKNIPGCHAGF